MLLKLALLITLLFLFYQDWRYRAVYWFLFPLLSAGLFLYTIQSLTIKEVFQNAGINLGFVLIQLVLLSLYFSLKHKKIVNITSSYLGLGDILFFLSVSFSLSPLNYVLFYTISLTLIALLALAYLLVKKNKGYKIPLAGYQAILFAGLLLADQNSAITLTNDYWIVKYLNL